MTHFVITFRIKDDANHKERYKSFIEHAETLVGGLGNGPFWDDTTSFIAMEAPGTARDICDSLYYGSMFDDTKDIMIVIDLDRRQKATFGDIRWESTLKECLGF